MKRKNFLRLAALVLALLALLPFAPHRMLPKGAEVEFFWCELYHENRILLGENMSYQGDMAQERLSRPQIEGLLAALEPLYCWRVWGEEHYSTSEYLMDISLHIDGQPLHIVLGRHDFCYSGNGIFRQFDIWGGDKAAEQIQTILGLTVN